MRRLATGEHVNDKVDWTNVIEEIESVGNEQLHAVSSLLTQVIIHRLKAMAWPDARDADNWRADAERFRGRRGGPLCAIHAAAPKRRTYLPSRAARDASDDVRGTAAASACGLPLVAG